METAHTLRPIDEIGTAARFNRIYGPQTKVGKMLSNTKDGDGALFHGRGYVQITGRRNYAKAKALTGEI
jgi:predicted chitinase